MGGSWGSRVAPGPPWNPPKCRDCVWRRPRASREPLGRLLGATGGVAKASREPPWSLPGDSQEPLGRRKSLTGASLEPPQGLSRASWESPAVFKTCPHPPMARECQLSYRNKAEPTCKRGSLVDQRPVLLAEDVEKRGRRNGRSPHESVSLLCILFLPFVSFRVRSFLFFALVVDVSRRCAYLFCVSLICFAAG